MSTCGVRCTMKKNLIVLLIGVVLALSSCGNSASTSVDKSPKSTASVETTSETTESECLLPQQPEFNLLASGWALVVASRGARDHTGLVLDFSDTVSDLLGKFKLGNCEGAEAMQEMLELSFDATVLATPFKITPSYLPGIADYVAVADIGNRLLELVGNTRSKFIPITCTGKADKTPECTWLPLS